jgi:hypothetical protein
VFLQNVDKELPDYTASCPAKPQSSLHVCSCVLHRTLLCVAASQILFSDSRGKTGTAHTAGSSCLRLRTSHVCRLPRNAFPRCA